ncbi:type IV secretion system protein VirB10 [Pelomonas sp. Root1444]|uniref:type IV secretion system protein VirB10 n=1 Tax=Pelomonas sp. Root1444 TaxID=1736464 RepID=UPI00070362C9|nr:type IV secretion system protein VirB10 [Pelomonas sp. Root1444]KQY88256.1 type IV secretion system protein VirB10 [Pelomonas sp. Root1444]
MSKNSENQPFDGADDNGGDPPDDTLSPLPGEFGIPNVAAQRRIEVSKKGLVAVALLAGSIVAVSAFGIQRFAASGKRVENEDSKPARDKPISAGAEPRSLEVSATPASASENAARVRIPAITATAEEIGEPIGIRRSRSSTAPGQDSRDDKRISPEDAPVLLLSTRAAGLSAHGRPIRTPATPSVSGTTDDADSDTADVSNPADPMAATSRNLKGYQRQLQGLLDNLTKTTAMASGGAAPAASPLVPPAPPTSLGAAGSSGLFGGQLQSSVTPKATARMLGNRSLTLVKGTAFSCALKTRVISATSGLVGCQVQRNVFGDDGRVLLIERGSDLDGEYRVATVRSGMVRIPVLWTRLRTPLGVTIDIESPATGKLGESGIDGHVDNRWTERIGAAMLLSLIDDSVKLAIQSQANDRQADTVVLPSTTTNTSKLAEKVLDSTINIPPLIYQNQGGIVGIYVARDLDFSSVYDLVPTANPNRH